MYTHISPNIFENILATAFEKVGGGVEDFKCHAGDFGLQHVRDKAAIWGFKQRCNRQKALS